MTDPRSLWQYGAMCTILCFSGLWPDTPLIIAANRDEFYRRPAGPPTLRMSDSTRLLAPMDVQAGGTWLGINDHGVFVGITNRFASPHDSSRRSRGALVMDALESPTAEDGAARMALNAANEYNGFHLLLADRHGAWCVWNDTVTVRKTALGAGVHAVTERSYGAADDPRRTALLGAAEAWGKDPSVVTNDTLTHALSHHDPGHVPGTCIHIDSMGYGTRSSSIIRLTADVEEARYLHAEGPPCTTEYDDYSGVLVSLLADGNPLAGP